MSNASLWVEADVEGIVDEAVARAVAESRGLRLGNVYGRQGKGQLLKRLSGYMEASIHSPWFVLLDLDTDAECAPAFLDQHASIPPVTLCLRVAVREVESWIMADRSPFARFMGVSGASVPGDPDELDDPKQTLVNLAQSSRSREIRNGIVPTPGGHRTEGPLYTTLLTEFVEDRWSPGRAATRSPSLTRCLAALERLARHARGLI
jgi:hypothetical protein